MNRSSATPGPPGTTPWPGPGSVHVWTADMGDGAHDADGVIATLSSDERARAERLISDVLRRRFVLAHGLLRRVLAGYLGARPEAVEIAVTAAGKPGLAGPSAKTGLVFNLAHSETSAVVAVGSGADVGVDVERLGRDRDALALAKRFFPPAEFAALSRLPEADRDRAFLTCWTRKEAIIKAHGGGMAVLGDVEAGFEGAPNGIAVTIDGTRFAVRDLDGPAGCVAAVARAGEGLDVVQRKFS